MSKKPTTEARELILAFFKKNPGIIISMQEIKIYLNDIAPEKFSHGVITSAIGNLIKHGEFYGLQKPGYNAYRFVGSKNHPLENELDADTITPLVIELLQKTQEEITSTIQGVDVLTIQLEDIPKLEKLKEVVHLLQKAQSLLKS